jgi:hypothetical protein
MLQAELRMASPSNRQDYGLSREDWLLLLVGLPDPEQAGIAAIDRVRAQKGLFVLGEELKPLGFYSFKPYHYGPFDRAVYEDADLLCARGLLTEHQVVGRRSPIFDATEEGIQAAGEIARRLTPQQRSLIIAIRRWLKRNSFNDLVKAIYKKWPEMQVNSRFSG